MNREQRRKQGIKPKLYTEGQVKQIVAQTMKQTRDQGMRYGIDAMTACFILSLSDVFEFGPKRIYRLLDKVNLQFACLEAGTVKIGDIVQEMYDKFDIELRSQINVERANSNKGNI